MPNPEWGVKRVCPDCGEHYYDLQRDPILCPECEAPFVVVTKDKSASLKADLARAKKAGENDKDLDDDDDDLVVDDDDNDDDDVLIDDDDDDDDATSLSDEDNGDDDEAVEFADDVLLDDDDDDDDDVSIDDIGDVGKKDDSES